EREGGADNVDVPAQQVDLGEGQIFRADHQGDKEIPQYGRNGWNQEEEDHGHAVHREHAVVGVRAEQVAAGGQQVQADHHGEEAANEKEERDGSEIDQG